MGGRMDGGGLDGVNRMPIMGRAKSILKRI